MRVLDLFTGIGGFTLAVEWVGFNTVGMCEINPFCISRLENNWPTIPITIGVENVYREKSKYGHVDIITAGVPCQPASIAGKRFGANDKRWLWPEFFNALDSIQPEWVVCENPTGILTLDEGDRFAEIIERFQQSGYGVIWDTISARQTGAGHLRKRVWIVAHSMRPGLERHTGYPHKRDDKEGGISKTNRHFATENFFNVRTSPGWWENQSPVSVMDHGLSDNSFRKQATIAIGNSIVPQVAFSILKAIKEVRKH